MGGGGGEGHSTTQQQHIHTGRKARKMQQILNCYNSLSPPLVGRCHGPRSASEVLAGPEQGMGRAGHKSGEAAAAGPGSENEQPLCCPREGTGAVGGDHSLYGIFWLLPPRGAPGRVSGQV